MGIEDYPSGLWDRAGGLVDRLTLSVNSLQRSFHSTRAITRDIYERELDFYFSNGFIDNPSSFFVLPEKMPEYRVVEQSRFGTGRYQVICFESGYSLRNPLLFKSFTKYGKNKLVDIGFF